MKSYPGLKYNNPLLFVVSHMHPRFFFLMFHVCFCISQMAFSSFLHTANICIVTYTKDILKNKKHICLHVNICDNITVITAPIQY